MKKIEFKSNERKYDIGGEVFTTRLSDKELERVVDTFIDVDTDSIKEMAQVKEQIDVFMDMLFGEGAGDKIYKITGSFTQIYITVFIAVAEDIGNYLGDLKKITLDGFLEDL